MTSPWKSQSCVFYVVSFSIADRQSALEAELQTVQTSRRDLENFVKWLQEAETTANVLADASQRENALQDSVLARQLRQQMLVSVWEATGSSLSWAPGPPGNWLLFQSEEAVCTLSYGIRAVPWITSFFLDMIYRILNILNIRLKTTLFYRNNCVFRARDSGLLGFLPF
jgi:hypothetical protein